MARGPIRRASRRAINFAEPSRPEIVVGLVAGIGAPLEQVQRVFKSVLRSLGYSSQVIHLSKMTQRFRLPTPLPSRRAREAARINAMMNRGNEARLATQRNDILALLGIGEIAFQRGAQPAAIPGKVFVLRQLKQPEEVFLLRRTYGHGFHLLGVYCPTATRRRNLRDRGMTAAEVRELITRDEHEHSQTGQRVRDTFHLADVFVDAGSGTEKLKGEIRRFFELVLGIGINGPTIDEFGMFHANASALRSAQLGRQVGASILGSRGEVIAVGTNDVPCHGGGLYWEGDPGDARDHVLGRDSSDEMRETIVREITERLTPDWNRMTKVQRRRLIELNGPLLRSTTVSALTEFGRAVHAEAEAILSAARMGVSTRGARLYCTTFPCHVCAKHIVAAGIEEVVYIEPYPKSRASSLYDDSISIETARRGRVLFRPFVGVAPTRFAEVFSMRSAQGEQFRRKDERGHAILDERNLRLRMPYQSALDREDAMAKQIPALLPKGVRS
jgi:cytidine deaminase